MNKLVLLGAMLVGISCAPAMPAVQPPVLDSGSAADRSAVIAAVESLFAAMRTRDTSAIRAAFAPNTHLVSIRMVEGAPQRINIQPLSAFITSIGGATQELIERMWDPRVEVAGEMASLWAPYDFRIGTTFSHCGHDAVHLARTGAGWKIVGITYTVTTAGCTTR